MYITEETIEVLESYSESCYDRIYNELVELYECGVLDYETASILNDRIADIYFSEATASRTMGNVLNKEANLVKQKQRYEAMLKKMKPSDQRDKIESEYKALLKNLQEIRSDKIDFELRKNPSLLPGEHRSNGSVISAGRKSSLKHSTRPEFRDNDHAYEIKKRR